MVGIRARKPWAAVLAAVVVGAGVGVAVAFARLPETHHATLRAAVQWRAGAKAAPAIGLRDEHGRRLTWAGARGHVVVLTFLDSRCRLQCPVEARQLTSAWRSLRPSGARLLVVSTDPWGDTPRSERRFAAHARWSMPWHWVSGTPAQLRPVWRAYGIGVQRQKGDVAHGVGLYVIDSHGFERAAYLPPFLPRDLAHDVQTLGA